MVSTFCTRAFISLVWPTDQAQTLKTIILFIYKHRNPITWLLVKNLSKLQSCGLECS